MKRGVFALAGLVFALLLPSQALAQVPSCSSSGYTVVFVNGIFNTQVQAQEAKNALAAKLGKSKDGEPVRVELGYNPTHLGGAGDLFESYFPSWDTYDLNTILLDIYPKVTTRKMLVVGHSQGSVYANKIYEYLLGHGEPKGALGVYAVGTPDSYVAGGGKYLTYALDPVIGKVRLLPGFNPLPANIDLVDLSPTVPVEGHSFINQYLAGAGGRIVSDIQGELSGLSASGASEKGDCFTPPTADVAYKIEQVALAVADPVASATRDGVAAGYQGAKTAVVATAAVVHSGYSSVAAAVSSIKSLFSVNLGTKEQDEATFLVAKALYGSSLEDKDIKELLGTATPAKVAVSATPAAPAAAPTQQPQPGLVLGAQTDTPSSGAATPAKVVSRGHSSRYGGKLDEVPKQEVVPEDEPAQEATTTDAALEEATSTEEATTPEVVEEEIATSTATSTDPAPEATSTGPVYYTMASQPDESFLCPNTFADDGTDEYGWRECFMDPPDGAPEVHIPLGKGSGLGGGTIHSVTVALDTSALAGPWAKYHDMFVSGPWLIFIHCYTDAAYTQTCPDWIAPNSWNSSQMYLLSERMLTHSDDEKYWTAYFDYDSSHGTNFDNSFPVRFNPEYYYQLIINDNGWPVGAYGSATEPYWVLIGQK